MLRWVPHPARHELSIEVALNNHTAMPALSTARAGSSQDPVFYLAVAVYHRQAREIDLTPFSSAAIACFAWGYSPPTRDDDDDIFFLAVLSC
jgi:hypothetical protein